MEAVIDKDACGAKLANELGADGFIILTDGGGIWQNFGKPNAREMKKASPGKKLLLCVVYPCGGVFVLIYINTANNLHIISFGDIRNHHDFRILVGNQSR